MTSPGWSAKEASASRVGGGVALATDDLPHRIPRNSRNHVVAPRLVRSRDLCTNERPDLVDGGAIVTEHHLGDDDLSERGIVFSTDEGFDDRRVLPDDRLNGLGDHVEASRDDEVRSTTNDAKTTLSFGHEVPRREPPLGVAVGKRPRTTEDPHTQCWSPDVERSIDDAQLDARQCTSNRPRNSGAVEGLGDGEAGLGHSVAFEERHPAASERSSEFR